MRTTPESQPRVPRRSAMAVATFAAPLLLLVATGITTGCVNDASKGKGEANVQVTLDKVGALGKSGATSLIEMKVLLLTLRSPGEATRRDTLTLSGNGTQSVLKTYSNLTTKKTWTLEAQAKDAQGISVYRDSVKFTVPPEGVTEVNLQLKSTYSMLRASFFPIRDSVTRCQLWVDGSLVSDSAFPKQSRVGDTIVLTRDYLLAYPPGRVSTIRMDVYGNWFGETNILLYRGEASFPIYPGRDTTYNVTLFRVGPPAPLGQGKITVTLGFLGTTTVAGFLDPSSWAYLGAGGFSSGDLQSLSIKFADTVPVLAYSDGGLSGRASVRVWDGTEWAFLGAPGFTAGVASNVSLEMAPGNTPYLAYQDGAHGGKATVMRWNGTAWVAVGSPGFSPDSANGIRLALSGGEPFIAFQDPVNGGKATVMRWNGTVWAVVGNRGFTAAPAGGVSLAIAAASPYVAFQDSSNGNKVTVMRWNGSDWSIVGTPGISSAAVDYVTIAASDVDSSVYVGYRQGNRPAVTRWDGTGWGLVGPYSFSPGYLPFFDLIVRGGKPYVAFQDGTQGGKATMMRWNGSAWEIMARAGVSDGVVDPVMAGVSSSGTPYMAFRDFVYGGRASVMRFAEYKFDCCTGGTLAKAGDR